MTVTRERAARALGSPAIKWGAEPRTEDGYAFHRKASARVSASPEGVFERLDDQSRLAEHMARSSAMMGGGRMTYAFDEAQGRAVGSVIRMGGVAFGLQLSVEEVVTEHDPPRRKAWRTLGEPQLVIIGRYAMGFEIRPASHGSDLTVWIGYDLPRRGWGRRAPGLAAFYARWCVRRMVKDAVDHFQAAHAAAR